MNVKFKITFEDDTTLESHDAMYNEIKDHVHALPPHNNKKWKRYEIISDDFGLLVGVDFQNGLFNIKGTMIHVGDSNGEAYTHKTDIQSFPVEDSRKILNGMPYFPIYGRRRAFGDWGAATLYFCGWKRKIGGKTIEKIAFVFPNAQIVIT